MKNSGYYRFPDILDDIVVFVSEDDLWQVSRNGGLARRLTANLSHLSFPKISPDGEWLVYAASEEGYSELYVMPVNGGFQKRITFLGTISTPLGWSEDNKYIFFSSNFEQAYGTSIYKISIEGGEPIKISIGNANKISFGEKGVVIGRHNRDAARWKRYKGGTAGEIWIDNENNGEFHKLIDLKSNLNCPMWIKSRIYFISDHEGIANIYSCTAKGRSIKRHTDHKEFFVRNASTDGNMIVYHAGADLFTYDIRKKIAKKIEIEYGSSLTQTNRKFISANKYLQGFDLNYSGTHTTAAVRGKVVSFANWSGPISQIGKKDGIRYRMPTWLKDEDKLVVTTDEIDGEDRIVLVNIQENSEELFKKIKLGRIHGIAPSPQDISVMITNHKNELIHLDLEKKKAKTIDTSDYQRIGTVNWSPDGKWICYDYANTMKSQIIKIAEISTGKTYEVTKPLRFDFSPIFSPDGKYLYFIGDRTFYPIYDAVQFELSFIKSSKFYAIPLEQSTKSPLILEPKSPASSNKDLENAKKGEKKKEVKVKIDFEDIEKRLIELPIEAGFYDTLHVYERKIFFRELPKKFIKSEESDWLSAPKPTFLIKAFDLDKQTEEILIKEISDFKLSLPGNNMIVRKSGELSIYKTGEKPKEKIKNKYSLEGGAINMTRIKISLKPREEWKQMYREAWLLQREHFWTKNMSGINWEIVYQRYFPLLDRVGCRGEFSDLIWEMQGELGTSHCYEFGGDYRAHPRYGMGKLGCSYELSKNKEYYVFKNILFGDSTNVNEISPLLAPAVNIKEGEHLLAINGTKVNENVNPCELLVNFGGQDIILYIK